MTSPMTSPKAAGQIQPKPREARGSTLPTASRGASRWHRVRRYSGRVRSRSYKGGHKGQDDGADVDRTIVAEELAKQSQQDEHDGQGVEEHEDGDGVVDDGAQPQVGEQEGDRR